MLFFFISCFSLILLSKSLSLKPLPPWASEMRLLSPSIPWLRKDRFTSNLFKIPVTMSLKKKSLGFKLENVKEKMEIPILDLPELALECILERLSPAGLCNMAAVCKSLREKCRSDHLWERLMKEKWGKLIGHRAYREWRWHIASRKESSLLERSKHKCFFISLSHVWPLSWFRLKLEISSKPKNSLQVDSIMSLYISLESGRFWFPAQVYNRENGHVGFMLSCYDAELRYDHQTDTFHARYPPHGIRTVTIEEGVQWDRLRAPPVDTTPHDLHISNCLNDLYPGDHIEIQWRRNKEFPYGWWYGVVGHLESCDGNESYCHCRNSDTVLLEFNQYTPGSRWRRAAINRKEHREEGNEADGFYGGIRKLNNKEEIQMWTRFWPTEILE